MSLKLSSLEESFVEELENVIGNKVVYVSGKY